MLDAESSSAAASRKPRARRRRSCPDQSGDDILLALLTRRSGLISALLLRYGPKQLVYQVIGLVNVPQAFQNTAGIHADGATDHILVHEAPGLRLNVSVEDDADNFSLGIDDWAAGVSADDIGGRDEIKRSVEVECARLLRGVYDPSLVEFRRSHPGLRQRIRRLVVVLSRVLVGAGEGGEVRNVVTAFGVALHYAVAEA